METLALASTLFFVSCFFTLIAFFVILGFEKAAVVKMCIKHAAFQPQTKSDLILEFMRKYSAEVDNFIIHHLK